MTFTRNKKIAIVATFVGLAFNYGIANYQIWITKEAGNDNARSLEGIAQLAAILLALPIMVILPMFLSWIYPAKDKSKIVRL